MDPHVQLMSQIEAQYMAKNIAYNNAAHVTCCRFGPVSYALRLTDKMSRYENLRLHPDLDGGDEAIDDTLRDAINYVCMCIGDLRADESDVGSTENVKETLKAIRSLANANEARITIMAAEFIASRYMDAAEGLLESVPYEMFAMGATPSDYMNFAAYLITLYLDRGE